MSYIDSQGIADQGPIECDRSISSEIQQKMDTTLGIREVYRPEAPEDEHVEEIIRNGYSVLEDAISVEDLDFLQSGILEKYYENQVIEIGGEDKLLSIGDQYSVKHLLAYDDRFMNLITNEMVLKICKQFLGEYFILHLQNAILSFPEAYNPASVWHRDLPYQHYTSSRPLAISALVIVDEFSKQTGGTLTLPGSHRYDAFPSPAFAKKHSFQISAEPGSILIFDAMMYHQCGFNQSNNIRRSISHIYTVPLIKQQVSLPTILEGRFKEDPFLRKLLGYETETAISAFDYRQSRIQNRGGNYMDDKNRIGKLND